MQSLQNQFLKAVASDVVHITSPYAKIMACINKSFEISSRLKSQVI